MEQFTNAVLALAVAGFIGCAGSPDADRGSWSGWTAAPNSHAERFKVWRRGEDRLILVFGHGGDRDTVGAYWLAPGASALLPPIKALRLEGLLGRIAMGSTTHVPFATALGRTDAIIACAHIDQVRDTALLRRVSTGKVKEIAAGDGLDREALIAMAPQALFAYPFGQADGSAVQHLGIPVIEVSEYLEEHPLGRAEWLRFFGALLGEEQKADSLFAGIKERYEALRIDTSFRERPTVLFGSVWDGQWWVPPGNSYMARLIEDAGGHYLFAHRKGTGNIAIDMETMLAQASGADYWGMVAHVDDTPNAHDFTNGDQRLETFEAVKRQRLFIGNTRVSDLFGQAVLEPHRVLGDLRWCLNSDPAIVDLKDYQPYFIPVLKEPTSPASTFITGDQ